MSASQDEQPVASEADAVEQAGTHPAADVPGEQAGTATTGGTDAATDSWAVPEQPTAPENTTAPGTRTVSKPGRNARAGIQRTRISGTWVAVVVAAVVLLLLLIFILQNLDSVTVHLFWGAPSLPLGVALLFAAIAGALLVALVGAARILQLRRAAKRRVRR